MRTAYLSAPVKLFIYNFYNYMCVYIYIYIALHGAHGLGCTKVRKEWRALVHAQMIEFYAAIFAWILCSVAPPSRALVPYHLERGGMSLHDAVEVNCENGAPTDINFYAQFAIIWTYWWCDLLIYWLCDQLTYWWCDQLTYWWCDQLTYWWCDQLTYWWCDQLTYWWCDQLTYWWCGQLTYWWYD